MQAVAQETISAQLEPGEELLWTGRPLEGVRLRAADLLMIPFSLVWAGFAVVWMIGAATGSAPLPYVAVGIPLVLASLYLLVGRFFVEARRRARTYYGLTNRRAILVCGLFSRRVTTVNLATLSDTSFKEKTDRTGSIKLGVATMHELFRGTGWPGACVDLVPTFELIKDVRQVYGKLLDAQFQVQAQAA